jgi:thiol-disulfide isomerase/thioredoxin
MPDARTTPPPATRRLPVIPITIGIVVLLAVVAALASRGGDDDDGATVTAVEETRPVTVEGVPLPEFADGQDAAVGATAPELVGAGFDGTPVEIAADGRPKVLMFLAHWCPHCQREVPVLAQWLADNGDPEGVDLYAVATGTTPDRPNYPPSAWLEREKLTVPTLVDDATFTAAQAYGLSAYPFFVALDGDNHVIVRGTGELTVEQWEALVALAAGSGTA